MARRPQLILPGSDKWPKQIVGDEGVVRSAYDQAVTAATRVWAYGTCMEPGLRIAVRQEELLTKEIETFAYHARRLIENTVRAKRVQGVLIPAITTPRKREWVPITRIINSLVHHESILFAGLKTEHSYFDAQGYFRDEALVSPKAKYPSCYVTSDRGKGYGFVIAALIDTFESEILERIEDLCSEQNIDLEFWQRWWWWRVRHGGCSSAQSISCA
jgi:hypothetical protein